MHITVQESHRHYNIEGKRPNQMWTWWVGREKGWRSSSDGCLNDLLKLFNEFSIIPTAQKSVRTFMSTVMNFPYIRGKQKKKAGLNGRNTRKSWCRKELYNSLHPAHVSHHMEFNRFFEAFPLTDFPSKFTLNTIFRWKIGSLLILWILRQHTCITSFAENWGGNLIFFSPRQ